VAMAERDETPTKDLNTLGLKRQSRLPLHDDVDVSYISSTIQLCIRMSGWLDELDHGRWIIELDKRRDAIESMSYLKRKKVSQ
jgi:hypothetical protein